MTTVSAIVLAAGESRRMGTINKLTLPVAGEPLVRRSVRTLLQSQLRELVVVLGHDAARVEMSVADLPVTVVRNRDYQDGQMISVHCGLEALSVACDGVMIALADQPLLTHDDIDDLIAAFDKLPAGSILVPTHAGQRGNPVILAAAHCRTILAGGRALGCRQFIDGHPEMVVRLETTTDHVLFDLDTPEDYAQLRERLEPESPIKQA